MNDCTDVRRPVVVGVDGSAASRAALRWAARQALGDRATVIAVEVYRPAWLAPSLSYAALSYGAARPTGPVVPPEPRMPPMVAALPDDERAVVTQVHDEGDPAGVLLEHADAASMLVLGHTQHGRLARLLAGSVASDCLRHARCPVVLVPATDNPDRLG